MRRLDLLLSVLARQLYGLLHNLLGFDSEIVEIHSIQFMRFSD